MSGSWKYKKGNPAYDRYIHSAGWRKKAGQRLEMEVMFVRSVAGKPPRFITLLMTALVMRR